MKQEELKIIEKLTGITPSHIKLADDGFWSRGYVIDGGRIVFKFKKAPEVSYQTEIKMLEFVNSLDLGINTQKVGWISPDNSYLGIYGVIGQALNMVQSPDYASIARQFANFLHQLHKAQPKNISEMTLEEEITAWQERYRKSHDELLKYFTESEIARLDEFILKTVPAKLRKLGENLVFSHGDLGDGNIFIDTAGKIGIIDFSEMLYLDEAADFMDIESDELRTQILDAYGANKILCEKVRLRVLVRPLFVFGDYARRGDTKYIIKLVDKIRELLLNIE